MPVASFLSPRRGKVTLTKGVLGAPGYFAYTFDDVGDFTGSGITQNSIVAEAVMHRGQFRGWAEGADSEVTIGFSANLEKEPLTDSIDPRPLALVANIGAGAQTTDAVACWDVVYEQRLSDTTTTRIAYKNVVLRADVSDAGAVVVLKVSGTGYGLEVA